MSRIIFRFRPQVSGPASRRLRPVGLLWASVLAVAALAVPLAAQAAPAAAQAATIRPANLWPTMASEFENENWGPDLCTRIDNAGALILGSGSCSSFTASSGSGTGVQLVQYYGVNGTDGYCLFYDATGARDHVANSYDLAPCSGSNADLWDSYSANDWSQWGTIYNQIRGDSMWADGTGTTNGVAYPATMNGTNPEDHWHADDGL